MKFKLLNFKTNVKTLSEKIRKHPILFLLLFILCFFVIFPAGRNYDGYCTSKGRSLSDQEKIEYMVKDILAKKKVYVLTGTYIKGYKDYNVTSYYSSVSDFLEKNPNCCKVIHGIDKYKYFFGPNPRNYTILEKFFDFHNATSGYVSRNMIVVRYKIEYKNFDGNKKFANQEGIYFQSNCGEPRESWIMEHNMDMNINKYFK